MVSPAQASWEQYMWPPSLNALSEASLSVHFSVALAGIAVLPHVSWILSGDCRGPLRVSSCVPTSSNDRRCRFWGRTNMLL